MARLENEASATRAKNLSGKGTRGPRWTLKNHPLFEQIDEYLRARYSPQTVLSMLAREYASELDRMPPLPSARTLERYRQEQIPEADLLPRRLIERRLEGVNRKVDLWQSLQDLYVMAEERVAKLAAIEDQLQLPVPGVDKVFATVLAVGKQMWEVGQDLGVYPRQGRSPTASFAPGRGTDDTDDVTDEEIEMYASALYLKRTGKQPPVLGQPAPKIVNGVAELQEP
jgi:hypothetical protein